MKSIYDYHSIFKVILLKIKFDSEEKYFLNKHFYIAINI
jgi:hypothetical protein